MYICATTHCVYIYMGASPLTQLPELLSEDQQFDVLVLVSSAAEIDIHVLVPP